MKKSLRTSSRPALVDLRTVAGNGRGRGVIPAVIPAAIPGFASAPILTEALLQAVTGGGRGRGLIVDDPTMADDAALLDG
jgi:hypothetical protein